MINHYSLYMRPKMKWASIPLVISSNLCSVVITICRLRSSWLFIKLTLYDCNFSWVSSRLKFYPTHWPSNSWLLSCVYLRCISTCLFNKRKFHLWSRTLVANRTKSACKISKCTSKKCWKLYPDKKMRL